MKPYLYTDYKPLYFLLSNYELSTKLRFETQLAFWTTMFWVSFMKASIALLFGPINLPKRLSITLPQALSSQLVPTQLYCLRLSYDISRLVISAIKDEVTYSPIQHILEAPSQHCRHVRFGSNLTISERLQGKLPQERLNLSK